MPIGYCEQLRGKKQAFHLTALWRPDALSEAAAEAVSWVRRRVSEHRDAYRRRCMASGQYSGFNGERFGFAGGGGGGGGMSPRGGSADGIDSARGEARVRCESQSWGWAQQGGSGMAAADEDDDEDDVARPSNGTGGGGGGLGSESSSREAPPPLRVQRVIPVLSAVPGGELTARAIIDQLEMIACATPPLLPSIGFSIPSIWLPAMAFLRALRDGLDPSESVRRAFEGEPPLDPRIDASADRKRPYARVEALRVEWEDEMVLNWSFSTQSGRINVPPSAQTVEDALKLLADQGEMFVSGGIAYLDPAYVTTLVKPLVDHRLSSRVFALQFAKHGAHATELLAAVDKLVASGELRESLLPLLWKDTGLCEGDYESVLDMLADAGVLFEVSSGKLLEDHLELAALASPHRPAAAAAAAVGGGGGDGGGGGGGISTEVAARSLSPSIGEAAAERLGAGGGGRGGGGGLGRRWILPMRLPEAAQPSRRLDVKAGEISIREAFDLGTFVPPGLVERLMAASYSLGSFHQFWRHGALLDVKLLEGASSKSGVGKSGVGEGRVGGLVGQRDGRLLLEVRCVTDGGARIHSSSAAEPRAVGSGAGGGGGANAAGANAATPRGTNAATPRSSSSSSSSGTGVGGGDDQLYALYFEAFGPQSCDTALRSLMARARALVDALLRDFPGLLGAKVPSSGMFASRANLVTPARIW